MGLLTSFVRPAIVAAYDVASPEPTFNFETDMELLQALPLAKDSQVVIKNVSPAPDGSIWVKTLLW